MAGRSRLSDRLKRIRETDGTAPRSGTNRKVRDRPEDVPQPPEVEGRADKSPPRPAGLPPEWHPVGPFAYRREIRVEPDYPGGVPSSDSLLCGGLKGHNGRELVFFDTETTGLSGGAGTHIFLFGTARVTGKELELVQLLLTDFPGEIEFLRAVREELDPGGVLVSYNGKGFDSQLLATRCIMNGIPPGYYDQVDLLYPVRRFWGKMLPACNLSTVEERLLGVERDGDIPGYAVPARYFEFLDTPRYDLLRPVIDHNAQDVVSLALLYSRIDLLLEDPRSDSADFYGAGRFLAERGRPLGEKLIMDEADRGNPEALKYLSLLRKRRGDYPSLLPLWKKAWRTRGCLFSALELAKYLEHREGDLAEALAVVEEMLPRVEKTTTAGMDLVKRKLRLEAKLLRRYQE